MNEPKKKEEKKLTPKEVSKLKDMFFILKSIDSHKKKERKKK